MSEAVIPPPLAGLGGTKPPAPAWFDAALGLAPERGTVEVEGAQIETLAWGDIGKPGLLLLHGGMAHADWWSFIAPFFAETHRVVAFSWSGMGGSGWREAYNVDLYVQEVMAVAEARGLFASDVKPVIMAHSFGGFPTIATAAKHGGRFRGVIVIDSPIVRPEERAKREAQRAAQRPPRDTVIYDSLPAALARFRLMPVQESDNLFIIDHIARHSLRQVQKPDGAEGWTWKFDPFMWSRNRRGNPGEELPNAQCSVCYMWGARSSLFPKATIDYVASLVPKGSLLVEIPDCDHHVMVDQPLALVTAARTVLSAWQA
ncbi:alpha/beta hydrolase [Phreatobacter aquaticus]|uniref:Alpha/beta hydrolase n=1 Tax=Phreatobacter aquaticus TaxID=2570229 RepID=A0A4D7QD67_9HYPH|nr:alpha/beta hydrolase [Phreatobacter aquaticus]QCK85950.1 alpha/beta hydrolase [Phreatobacter aquaticus]